MGPRIVCLAIACVFLVHNVLGESSENVSSTNPIPAKPFKDELFIDDDSDNVYGDTDKLNADDMMLDEEGSGMGSSSKGTGVEDMESSGSGYGPDDEDAPTNSKNKEKPGPDSEDDEDEDIDDEDETDENNDFDKKPMKTNFPTTASTSTTSTTTTTAKNYDDEQIKPRIILDNVNEGQTTSIPETSQTTTTTTTQSPPPSNTLDEHSGSGVYISPNSHPERTSSFFAQPGILAAVIGGAVVGLLCAILVVMFIVYRMRKKDEGSYPLEETKRSPATNPYLKSTHREFYA